MTSARDLHEIANLLRGDVLKMVKMAGAGHVAGPMSSADLFAVLYFSGLLNMKKDKVVLSCGHYCPVLYSALAHAGYFPVEELTTFMKLGSRLPGHPEKGLTPGIEVSSGPLGQGVSVAVGMALARKIINSQMNESKVYCVLSDGEIQEGQVWEAFNFAVHKELDNLTFILDRNKIQIENYVSQIATYGGIIGRFEAFGLYTLETDGNDIEMLSRTIEKSKTATRVPTMIAMNTIAGKGVSFMENKPIWHDRVPTDEEMKLALLELRAKHV